MAQQTDDTVVTVKGLDDAVRQLANSVREKIKLTQTENGKSTPTRISGSITFSLSDLPNFSHLAGHERSYREIMDLRKDIRLATGLAYSGAFTFAGIDELTRDAHVNGDLVTISVGITLKAKRS